MKIRQFSKCAIVLACLGLMVWLSPKIFGTETKSSHKVNQAILEPTDEITLTTNRVFAGKVPEASIRVSNKILHKLSPNLTGFNLEDLNYQTYGGLDSQLLHGQDFEEHVDVDDLLPVSEREKRFFYLRRTTDNKINLVTYGVERASRDEKFARLRIDVENRLVPWEQFPPDVQTEMNRRITGERQISYYWRALTSIDARAKFTLTTDQPFNGLQDQQMEFISGSGEIGVANHGLFRRGIRLEAGKTYDGFLRVRSETPQDVYVSLRDVKGKILAEKTLHVGQPQTSTIRGFEKVAFELTPSESVTGTFVVSLKRPGVITLGYAFLQPGEWGRYKGLPLKKELVEAIKGMGPSIIRYGGDMVSRDVVKDTYLWKNMIGPRDLRIPYTGAFNPFASHCFGIFEFLDMANAIGVIGVVIIRSDESPQSYLELLEYANGPAGSRWGDLRIQHGHPDPYDLKYIGFGNEEGGRPEQLERFKAVAKKVWAQYPEVVFVMGDSWVRQNDQELLDKSFEADQPIGRKLEPTAEVLRFAKSLGKQSNLWWDLHINSMRPREVFHYTPIHPADGIMGALRFRDEVLKLCPDCEFNLAFLEENGAGYTMYRALGRVRTKHAIMRTGGDKIVAAAAANTLQADDLDRVWGQGQIFFNEEKVWFQPPYYVEQMISRNWAPQVLECEYSSSGSHINALARKTEDGKALILTVANFDANPVQAEVRLEGFNLQGTKTVKVETLESEILEGENTADNPLAIAPKTENRQVSFQRSTADFTFPKFSFTLLRIEL